MKKTMKLLYNVLIVSSLMPGFTMNVFAATSKTATNKATATLASSCSFTMENMSFGNVVPGQTSSTATATLNVVCSNNLAYTFNTVHPSDGVDCPFMLGQTKSDKLHYWMNYQGTVLRNATGGRISKVGTGAIQPYVIQGIVNQLTSGFNCEAPQNNPGANNMNPYVSPDTYSTTANMVITF